MMLLEVAPSVGDVVLLLVLASLAWYIWSRLTSTLPPGPMPLPLLGNYFTFSDEKVVPMWEQLRRLSAAYGKVMTVYRGTVPMVILNDFDAIKEALITQQDMFVNRPNMHSTNLVSNDRKDVVVANFGYHWSLRRRLMMVALKKFGDKATVSQLVCESTTDICEEMLNEQHKQGKVSECNTKMHLLIYNIIGSLAFGKHFTSTDLKFNQLVKDIQGLVSLSFGGIIGDVIPALKFVPTPATSRLKRYINGVFQFLDESIAEHQASLDAQQARDITDAVLITKMEIEKEEGRSGVFSNVHVRQLLLDVFLAGTDTTAITLLWCVLYFIHYPHLQEKVVEEIETNVGTRSLRADDRANLPFSEAFLLEVLRVRPTAPLSVPHTVSGKDASLYSHHIPPGTFIVPNIWACHYDPRFWSEPGQFNPDRFLHPHTGKLVAKHDSYLPFGVGRRSCAGEPLARLDTWLIMATLVQKVKFCKTREGVEAPSLAPHAYGLIETPGEFQLRVESR